VPAPEALKRQSTAAISFGLFNGGVDAGFAVGHYASLGCCHEGVSGGVVAAVAWEVDGAVVGVWHVDVG
jgi:hypothetical protein